jgi:hypothetical protein
MQEKSKVYNIHGKNINSSSNQGKSQAPSNQVIWVVDIKFRTQGGSNQDTRFLNAKYHTPPKPKAKHNKHQSQLKTRTPPEVKNPMFYQMSLDKPQGKHMPLKQ